jgi:class 3 adenylate cyclase
LEHHALEKIKTIGDAYMVAGGLSKPRADHATAVAEFALEMQAEIQRLNQQYDMSIQVRIGVCTGPVVAGVIGRDKFAFDIWGETVNLACQLESAAAAGTVQIAESTRELLKDQYVCEPKRIVNLPGQNHLPTYRLLKKS